jgi:DNA-directed RNA polymerase specialized sigma24 family protein
MSRPVEDEVESRVDAERLWEAMRFATTELQFRVLILLFLGHSRQEIADDLGKTRRAVDRVICRGLAAIREWLREGEDKED